MPQKKLYQTTVIIFCLAVLSCSKAKDNLPTEKMLTDDAPYTALEARVAVSQEMFDDFNYSNANDVALTNHQWDLRNGDAGGPGPSGTWTKSNISFVSASATDPNKLMRLVAVSGPQTTKAEISTPRKYFEGTYAARVKFIDAPASGPDGANIVETFFTISESIDTDPNYSELDFEYLPNGGFGYDDNISRFHFTAWASTTNQKSSFVKKSFEGWHLLVMTVFNGVVNQYVDGVLLKTFNRTTTNNVYPRTKMVIDFNLWFDESAASTAKYFQDVDWVYHAKNKVLSSTEVKTIVAGFRTAQVKFKDNVQ
jgi:hypothetical protein